MSTRTLAIIQARMSSSRLPGKVLLDIAGQPMLAWVVDRARRAQTIDEVVIATTLDPSDDAVQALCRSRDYLYYRGSLHDVLDRYYQAARLFEARAIVRLTADCPLIDPGVIDTTVNAFFRKPIPSDQSPVVRDQFTAQGNTDPYDFAANRLPPPWKRTFPIGLDVEVCTFEALERAWKEADRPHQREHVMPYLYEQAGRFRVLVVDHDPDYGSLRWTVDTADDLELVRRIYMLFKGRADFTWLEVLDLFERYPELKEINAAVRPKSAYDTDSRL
jgi:spore coat polysaccharide biosynthesis protein SpsF